MNVGHVERVTKAGPQVLYSADAAKQGATPGRREPLRVVDAHSFLTMEIPPREKLLGPWLLSQSLNMIYARRGTGKTHLALGIGYAVAAGTAILGWQAPKARKVLYVDGEMLAGPMQERLADIVQGSETDPEPGMLNILTPDLQKGFMPNLATVAGQDALDEAIPAGTELIILDSLSSLMRSAERENDAESWTSVASWVLSQRVAGRSILFLHHAGKSGTQRGTSKREDLLDVVLALRPPTDHQPNQGAKFEIHIEKSRALCGEFQPIEAALTKPPQGGVAWTHRPIEESLRDRIERMAEDGMSKREIAEELHVNRSTVYRTLKGVARSAC